MPTIPTYGGPKVSTAPLPSVRVPTSAPEGAFESGLQQAMPALINASAQRDAIAEKAALDADEVAVNTAKVAHIDQQTRDLQDPQSGVLNMRGTNALGALPEAQQRYKKLTDGIAGSLKNDRQKAMYAHFAQSQYNEVAQQVSAHTRAEYNRADIESTNSLLDNGLAKVHIAPEQADAAITEARKAIIAFGARQGWSPETLKLKDAVHVSDIHAAAISSLVQRGTYEAAQQADAYLTAHRAELRGGQLDDAEKLVDTALGESSGYAEADKILGINQDTSVLPSVGQQQGEVPPQGTTQQAPATSRAEALARAEAIRDPKARKAATDAIVSHFTRLETMQHLDRQDALQKVVAHIESTGGRLPRASREYQLLVGHPEEAHALSAQDRILRPPKDPGDPELFMSHLNMATISPASREQFAHLDFTGKDGKGLNTSQRTRLIQMQGQFRGQEAKDPLVAEKLRFDRENALLKIGDPSSAGYIADKAQRDLEVSRIKRHYNQLQAAHGETAPVSSRVQPQQGSAPAGAVSLGGEPAAPAPAVAPLFANNEAPTQSMLDDVVRKGPKYADYLRQHGYDVPAYEALVLKASQKAQKPRKADPARPLTRVLSGDEWEQSQYAPPTALQGDTAAPGGISRVLTGDEWEHAQTLPGPAVKSLRISKLPPIPAAARDMTATGADNRTKGKALAAFDVKDPTTYANPVLRQLVNPAMEHPFATAALGVAPFAIGPAAVSAALAAGATATTAAAVGSGAAIAVGTGMVGDMAKNIALHGYQKHFENIASPDARKELEADPERVSGEAAAFQAAMLGLAPLIHVGVKGVSAEIAADRAAFAPPMEIRTSYRPPQGQRLPPRTPPPAGDMSGMELLLNEGRRNTNFATTLEQQAATTRIPNDVPRPKGFETSAEDAARLKANPRRPNGYEVDGPFSAVGRVKPLATESPADALQATADKLNDPMRPRRRAQGEKNYFETEQGAEVLGMTAARHGLPSDASPFVPETPSDVAWKSGHAAAAESYPEGFSMGGALTDNRIPGAGEIPPAARGIEGLQQSTPVQIPEGVTTESAALAAALKPSPFRGHTTDALAQAALDAQAAIEAAQEALARTGEGSAEMQRYYNEKGDLTDFEQKIGGNPFYAKTPELTLARAKGKMQQIEREYALRGVRGDDLADVIAGAKESRAERQAMQEEESLALLTGDDPFATPAPVTAPVAAGEGSARGLTPVEGTGKLKTRGLAAHLERDAVHAELARSLGDLPEYRTLDLADQAQKALDLITSDPVLARQVALGEAPAPLGLHPESVFVELGRRAKASGDAATVYDLAHGKLTEEATTMGQRLRIIGELDSESPISAIQAAERVAKKGKDVPKETLTTVEQIRAKLQGVKVTTEAFDAFIQSLKC